MKTNLAAVNEPLSDKIAERAKTLFSEQLQNITTHTDHIFARLMVFQWVFGIGLALLVSPRTGRELKASPTCTCGRQFSLAAP
jgi:hypothetical protein